MQWTRRQFGRSVAGTAAGMLAGRGAMAGVGVKPGTDGGVPGRGTLPGPLRGRYLTHVSVVRVNQVEVTRTRNLGEDEAKDNRVENLRSRREAFGRGCPKGRMTWAISWLALRDDRQQYREVRQLLASFHDRYGDEVTFIPGGYFAPMYNTREENRRTIHEALGRVSAMVGGGYRPQSLVAGFLDAENQWYLAQDEGIHVCQGQIWSQHGVDHGDGDGGISYPYYPSREHYLKPAQGSADFVDCVCLDGWTCDFLSARHEGVTAKVNSRMGVGPIETVQDLGEAEGRREMMATTAVHFDGGAHGGVGLNGFGWVTAIWETSLGHDNDLQWWLEHVTERWPDTQVIPEGEFGMLWRGHTANNTGLNYRFVERGTGAPGSEKDMEIRWFMNREFRLALLRNVEQAGAPERVIDLTRYDLPAREPAGPQREWSLMNVINQKGSRPEDKPVRLRSLPTEDQRMIFARYPELRRDL